MTVFALIREHAYTKYLPALSYPNVIILQCQVLNYLAMPSSSSSFLASTLSKIYQMLYRNLALFIQAPGVRVMEFVIHDHSDCHKQMLTG